MDYYKIGQRIRKYRKAVGLSQEQLAERVGISIPHMSHIETGNTKLSLPVLVTISEILEVTTDDILFDSCTSKNAIINELQEVFHSCSVKQLSKIKETIKAMKVAMDKYQEEQ